MKLPLSKVFSFSFLFAKPVCTSCIAIRMKRLIVTYTFRLIPAFCARLDTSFCAYSLPFTAIFS